ncbi:MAG TPA: glycosyltransferase, partial [Bacteroidota bacterium]|nr:glycosyltransferase [Bacteroidota bacterium]
RVSVTAFDPAWRPRIVRGLRRASGTIRRKPIYDVNLFVEEIVEGWIPLARVNCLVPHQEWFSDETRALVPRMDWLVCKTQFAVQLFQSLAPRTAFTGFTTIDRYDPTVAKDYNTCVHVAGSSLQKGSYTVNEVWLRHPRWPLLNLHWTEPTARPVPAPNIRCETSFVDERTLRKLQNRCGIHLCPSEAEGFGHYLVEAMSSAAVVITTDAPPMNELVRPERGVLAGYNRQAPQGAGMNYYVDPARLEDAVEGVLAMSTAERERMGQSARAWFLENDRLFRQRLWEVLQGMA